MKNETKTTEEWAVEKIQSLERKNWKLRFDVDALNVELGCVGSLVNALSLQFDNPESVLTDHEFQNALYAIENHIRRIVSDLDDLTSSECSEAES